MASFELKNGESKILDLGSSSGVSATNVSNQNAKFYMDYESSPGHWSPITGEKTIEPVKTFAIPKKDIGHDRVRVAATGKDDGTVIIRGQY